MILLSDAIQPNQEYFSLVLVLDKDRRRRMDGISATQTLTLDSTSTP